MSTSSWTSIDFFQISLVGYKDKTELYANGNMQVLVYVDIRAVDDNGLPVQLIQRDLNALSLVRAGSHDKIPDGWSYSQTGNRYLHTMPGTPTESVKQPVPMERLAFWVSTEVAGSVDFAASIKSPTGVVYNSFNSVSLSGIEINNYTLADVTFVRYNSANIETGNKIPLDQDNYYLSFKNNRNIVYVDWMGSDIPLFACESPSYPTSFYAWPLDAQIRQEIKNFPETISDTASIVVNDRPGQLCMTRLLFEADGLAWPKNFQERVVFSIFDDYGTHGLFEVIINNDENTMHISDYSGGGV
jgi:hypothetical protein